MARLIKIAYAGLTIGVGGNSSMTLFGRYGFGGSYTEATVTFDVLVRNSSRSSFLSAEAALIAAYSTPDQDLDVDLGGTDRHSFSQSLNTGFNARPSCKKIEDEHSTANSAHYQCAVIVQLPATLSGRGGRQSASITVEASPAGKKTVVIEGTYTALPAGPSSAVGSYEAAIEAFCTAVLADFTGDVFNLLTPAGYTYDDQNKVLRFRRIYEEVFYRESLSTADVTGIKGQKLEIERTTPNAAGDPSASVRPLERLRALYSCWVDAATTTDLRGLYNSTIRPLLLAELADAAQSGISITNETPVFNKAENTVTVVIEAVNRGGGLLYGKLEVEDQITLGKQVEPVWSDDPYAADVYDVPILWLRAYRRTTISAGGGTLAVPRPAGFLQVAEGHSVFRDQIGITGQALPIVVALDTFLFRRVNQPPGSSSGNEAKVVSGLPAASTDTNKTDGGQTLSLAKL